MNYVGNKWLNLPWKGRLATEHCFLQYRGKQIPWIYSKYDYYDEGRFA